MSVNQNPQAQRRFVITTYEVRKALSQDVITKEILEWFGKHETLIDDDRDDIVDFIMRDVRAQQKE